MQHLFEMRWGAVTLAASSSGKGRGCTHETYHQLTQEERYRITAQRMAGDSQARDCPAAGAHRSTISRELRRNVTHARWRVPRREGAQLRQRPDADAVAAGPTSAPQTWPGWPAAAPQVERRADLRHASGRRGDAAHQPRDDLPPHPLGQARRRRPVAAHPHHEQVRAQALPKP